MPAFLTKLINHTLSSSKDGVLSFARVASAIAFLASLTWVSYIVFKTHTIPDLGGVSLFTTSLYGVNKFSNALTPKKDNNSSQVQG